MSETMKGDSVLTEKTVAGAPAQSPKRQAIVTAAAELFLRSGYGAVSMDAIAAKAEVSKRTVYSHFSGKDELFAAVMMAHCALVAGEEVFDLDPDQDMRVLLTDLGVRFLTLVTSPEAVALYRTVVAEAERFPELGRTFYENGPQCWISTLTPYLGEKDRRGELRSSDPETAASFLLYLLKDPLHMRCTLGVQGTVTPAEIEAHAARAVGTFLELYAPK